MPKSIRVVPKKRGRPKTTGRGTLVGIRLHAPTLAAIDEWASRQDDEPSRPEAIRRMIEQALDVRSHRGGSLDAAAVSMPKDLGKRIERWAKAMGQDSHSEAMRHLLELGLKAPKKRKGVK
jgi:metal-responsive CopG/Arc/MetJ family transcriptional regulator